MSLTREHTNLQSFKVKLLLISFEFLKTEMETEWGIAAIVWASTLIYVIPVFESKKERYEFQKGILDYSLVYLMYLFIDFHLKK